MTNHQYDAIIVGGGIVGLSCALSLAQKSLNVALVERTPLSSSSFEPSQPYDLRVFAINHASQQLFKQLSVWQTMQQLRTSPYTRMFVWDKAANGEVEFTADMINLPELGHIIENQILKLALLKKIDETQNIKIISPLTLKSLTVDSTCAFLLAQSGEQLSAKLIIGADGAESWLRQQLDVKLTRKAYGHHAIVTTIETEKNHEQTAWEHFTENGPLAFLPLTEKNRCSIVWSIISDQADRLMKLDDEKFAAELAHTFNHRLGNIRICDKRVVHPLTMQHAHQYVAERVALVGDAIHTIHPLAGQGVNLGLEDIAALANIIGERFKQRKDIGSLVGLRQYERARKGPNLGMIALMEGFKQLFAQPHAPIKWLRGTGLNMTNRILPLKQFYIRQAMGK